MTDREKARCFIGIPGHRTFAFIFLVSLFFPLLYTSSAFSQPQIIRNYPLSKGEKQIAIDPVSGMAIVSNGDENEVYLLDITKDVAPLVIPSKKGPTSPATLPDAYLSIIANEKDGSISFFDFSSQVFINHLNLGGKPVSLALKTDSNTAVVAVKEKKVLSIINLSQNKVVGEISLKRQPEKVVAPPTGPLAVVLAQSRLLLVDIQNKTVFGEVVLKGDSKDAVISPDGGTAYVLADQDTTGNTTLVVINLNTQTILKELPLGTKYRALDLNPSTGTLALIGQQVINNSEAGLLLLLDAGRLMSEPTYNAETFELAGKKPADIAIDIRRNQAIIVFRGDEGALILQLPNPVPVLSEIVPEQKVVGDPGFTLTLKGEKFIASSQASFNSLNVETRFLTNEKLNAEIPGSLLKDTGEVPVKVTNPGPVGGASDSLNFVIRNPEPNLFSVAPIEFDLGQSVTLTLKGSNFLPASAVKIGNISFPAVFIDSGTLTTHLTGTTITVPGIYTITVLNPQPGGGSSYGISVKVNDSKPIPAITDFSPKQGTAGTVVTITGRNFEQSKPRLKFNGKDAVITSITSASIKTVVPLGATTGPITLETTIGSAASPTNFTVLSSQDFLLTLSAQSVLIPQNGSSAVIVSIKNAGTEPFAGLVKLSVDSAPSGIAVNFNPSYISLNQDSLLTINLSSGLSSQAVLNIRGTANVDGTDITKASSITVTPIAVGTTTVSGRIVASKDSKPIKDVTLKLASQIAVSNDAGDFRFADIPAGEQVLIIDGHTANTETSTYPSSIPVPVTIIAGQDNKLPYFIYLHEANTKTFTPINSSLDTIVRDPAFPDFEMRIPAGVQIIGWDGLPNEKVSVQMVARDRLPIPPPPNNLLIQSVYMFYFGKPGGGTPTSPIPVKLPNHLGSEPGTKFDMYYYDEGPIPDPNSHQWKKFGSGTVSDDGRQVVSDDGFGIPKFCCGAIFMAVVESGIPTPSPNPDSPTFGAEPVDLSTGVYLLNKTDMVLKGRISSEFVRTYRTLDYSRGPFGIGSSHNYDTRMTVSSTRQRMTYILPDGGKYYFYLQSDGTYRNTNTEKMLGSIAYFNSDNSRSLRPKDGSVYKFDSSGNLINIEDQNGNKITIARQSGGLITSIKEPAGRELVFSYDGSGRIVSITAPLGKTVQYVYNSQGTLYQVIDPNGGVTIYTYDSQNRMQTLTDARGITVLQNFYDEYGRVSKQILADGGEYKLYYFSASTPVRVEQPVYPTGGCIPIFVREGEPISVSSGMLCGTIYVNVPSSRAVPEDSTAAYSVNQTVVVNPNGSSTTYRFDGQGYLLSSTDGLGGQISYERQIGTNLLLSITDRFGRKTSFTYDASGNVASVTDPDGNIIRYEYDQIFNKLTKITDALGNTTKMSYDSKGNLVELLTPDSTHTAISYNQYGQPLSVSDALNNSTTFEYDDYGNLITTVDPLGNKTNRGYDIYSRLTGIIDPKGKITGFSFDNLDRTTGTTDAMGGKTRYAYDGNGNPLTVTDPKEQTITYTYNAWDKVLSMTDQFGRKEYYEYDLNQNLVKYTDRKGQVSDFTYDFLDRLVNAKYADGSTVGYSYDAGGRATTINDSAGGMISLSYNNLDRVVSEMTPLGSISYEYDALGRRTKMQVAGQEPVTYQYDASSRLTSVVGAGLAPAQIAYDTIGRRASLILPNGVTTNYSYDNARRLLNVEHLNPLNSLLEKISYAYDANGNRTGMNRLNVPAKLPNPASNITYNQANQMLTFDDKAITYDENGNMTTVTNTCGTTTYTWDARNRLEDISGYNPDCSPLTASFKYDALGRRIEKTIYGKTTQYLYDGWDIVQEIESGAVTVNYVRTLNIDEPLARVKANGTLRYYQRDALGSIITLTDETGSIKTQYVYEPFGKTETIGEAGDNPFQFAGRENDGTGLLYERNRYYSYELQRYLSEDPIGFAGGDINLFIRVGNNPVNWIDPYGLDATITLYPGASGFGHIGIGVNTPNTVGLYPDPNAGNIKIVTGQDVPGVIHPDTRTHIQTITIHTTPAQDQAMQNLINQTTQNPGNYNLYDRNCSTLVQDVLNAGGTHCPETNRPRTLMDNLQGGQCR